MSWSRNILCLGLFIIIYANIKAQPVPSLDENIPYLVTFSKNCPKSWGDDDFSQAFFFVIPKDFKSPVYIRVYDPDVGGDIDEINGVWNSKTQFSIFGGKGCYTDKDAQETDPIGNYKSGVLLATKTFGNDAQWDKKWYTFGPFNPTEGEFVEKFNGYIFKIIADGIEGDDGNLYRYFLSTAANENKPVEGANAFSYEYTFRMWDNPDEVSHIFPFVDDKTITVKISNFDWDNDGIIRIVSVARRGQLCQISGDDEWKECEFKIFEEEKNKSLDIQFIKYKDKPVKNNNVVVNVRNQYGELLPFYVIPIGGVPKYNPSIGVKKINKQ